MTYLYRYMSNTSPPGFQDASMTSRIWECDGIRLGHAVSRFDGFTSNTASSPTDVIRLHFGLRGNYSFHYRQLGRTFDLIGGHVNFMFSEGFDMEVQNHTKELETFGVQFPKALFIGFTEQAGPSLQRFSERVLRGEAVIFTQDWGAIDPPMQAKIQQILDCPWRGDWEKLFLLSRSIELLVLAAEACERSAGKEAPFIRSRADKEKIIAVRDLINERVSDPPNLSQIARAVGLNEFKLKKGFKETFHHTVFGYLTEQRLLLAERYLLDTTRSAADISAELGYATPQHFSNAFRKRFGITPLSLRKNP